MWQPTRENLENKNQKHHFLGEQNIKGQPPRPGGPAACLPHVGIATAKLQLREQRYATLYAYRRSPD